MRAARLPSTGAHLVVEEIPDPTPGPGQVVVKIAASGVCHSDVTIQNAGPGMPPRAVLSVDACTREHRIRACAWGRRDRLRSGGCGRGMAGVG